MEHDHVQKCAILKDEAGISECDCDGYHTFDELYDHRMTLYIALCRRVNAEDEQEKSLRAFQQGFAFDYSGWIRKVWRSTHHGDGKPAFGGGWFVLGINKEEGKQITYHLPLERWKETEFAETLKQAPLYDGHTPDDVILRLKSL